MREYAAPVRMSLPATGSLTDDVVANADRAPDRVALRRRTGADWEPVTAEAFLEEVRAAAKGLLAAGLVPGGRVALMARTRYEWTVLDYATWFAGGTTVPIYPSSTTDTVRAIVDDSGAGIVVVESGAEAVALGEALGASVGEVTLLCLDDGAMRQLGSSGAGVSDDELDSRRTSVTPETAATIIYTSGTTGAPKGCLLTHGNFMVEADAALDCLRPLFDRDDAATLLFLPLAHVFARLVQVGAIRAGAVLGHSADPTRLLADLRSFRPTFVLGVPRSFERLFNLASQTALANGEGRAFRQATEAAIAYSQALDAGGPGALLRARHQHFERRVYRGLRAQLGGACEFAISGGAPLGERLAHYFRGMGIPVLEGYGLTETTGALTVNRPGEVKIGSVGQPMPGTTLRVAEDGELLARGHQVAERYWSAGQAGEPVVDESGWLHTGDFAEIDEEGFVRVTGRRTELLVTAGGKAVSPTALEDAVREHPLVAQCMVVGDGRPFVSALVTLDAEELAARAGGAGRGLGRGLAAGRGLGRALAAGRGLGRALVGARPRGGVWAGRADPSEDPSVRAEVQGAIDEANRRVSHAEAIRDFRIVDGCWSPETGELTPTLKLRRATIARQYRREIAELYGE